MTDPLLTDEQITARLVGSPWARDSAGDGDAIVRDLELENFTAAVAAVNRVAALAEEHNHHPDILIHGWNKLRLTLSSHSAGGLTAADFELATGIDGLL
jgi:4a-hydroxytetrahydrobiopterin dehydratase